MAAPGTARPGVRRARGTAMTRHYHDIGGGADLVLPRRRRAAALLSSGSLKTYVTNSSSDLKYPSIARTCRRGGDAGPRTLELTGAPCKPICSLVVLFVVSALAERWRVVSRLRRRTFYRAAPTHNRAA